MKWTPGGDSGQIEDRRGESPGFGGGGGGGGFRFPFPGGMHLGLGGTVIVLILYFVVRGFGGLGGGGAPTGGTAPGPSAPARSGDDDPDHRLVQFVTFVVNDVQKVWADKLQSMGKTYRPAHLVLFTQGIRTGCGDATSEVGPFYCPADGKVYIDLSFYRELVRRFGAPGDFAQAYVIAHEYGHHIQDLLGIEAEVRRTQESHPGERNSLSVRLELQADCFAGIWAHSTEERNLLEAGDVDEALGAAAAVGDDRIQKQAGGRVNPETWTHGSAAQRSAWFKRGFSRGNFADCDTFSRSP
jgi:predicted metalloprotease